MKIIKISGSKGVARAEGLQREVDLQFIRSPKKGDFVMIHAGFAIEKIDKDKARQTLGLYRQMR